MSQAKAVQNQKQDLLIQGVYELFMCISNNDITLNLKAAESIKEFKSAFYGDDYVGMYHSMRNMSGNKFTGSDNNSKENFVRLIESFSTIKGEALTHNQKLNLDSLRNSFENGNSSVSDVSKVLSEMMEDVADSIDSLLSVNFDNSKVKGGNNYSEGVESILHSDLVVSTRRIGRDLNRLTTMLIEKHPENLEFSSLRNEVIHLKEGPSKFFQAVDVLSKLSWSIHKMNDEKINSDKEYLFQISSKFQNIARSLKGNNDLNNSSLYNLNSFEKKISNQMSEIKGAGRSSKDLSSMREKVLKSVEAMEESFLSFSDEQKKIIKNQKKVISEQSDLLSFTAKELKSTKEDLEITTKEVNLDHLTKLNNRKVYMDESKAIEKSWPLSEQDSAIMVLDIDYFKSINDNYGHHVGDLVLSYIGGLLNNLKKVFPACSCYRYGGEEFIIIVKDTSQKSIVSIANKIKEAICRNLFKCSNGSYEFKFTTSIGVAFFTKELNTSIDVFNEADKSLYIAKHNGRNMVCIANGEYKTSIDID